MSYETNHPNRLPPSLHPPGSRLLYVRDRYLRVHELQTGRDHPLVSMRRPGQSQGASLGQGPRSLQHNAFNPAESNVLVGAWCFVCHGPVSSLPLLLLLLGCWCWCCVETVFCRRRCLVSFVVLWSLSCTASDLRGVTQMAAEPSTTHVAPYTPSPLLAQMPHSELVIQVKAGKAGMQ